ncbi:MAG TPA: hypothetical protein VF755_12440, partial [Catenuloplanes sp.]
DGSDDVHGTHLGRVGPAAESSAAPSVDDEVVDGHLRHAEDHRQRVDAEQGQAHGHLPAARTAVRGVRAGQHGEHHAVRRVGEQPAAAAAPGV